MRKRILVSSLFFTCLAGCYKDHLYVQQEWVDRSFLASSHVNTPDPRQENPPQGQRLLVGWRFPLNLLTQQLKLVLTVRFWDNGEEVLNYPIDRSKGSTAFNFYDRKILTYRIQVVDAQNEIVETWEHQFWTKWIEPYPT